MSSFSIHFFSEEISFTLKQKYHIRQWLKQAIALEHRKLNELNFIFCSDNYLLKINKQYLNHDTFTDIITFDNSESHPDVTGDIFISIDRVYENAAKFNVTQKDELHRVIIHGTLHLLGYTDKTKSDKLRMTGKEDYYLGLRSF